MRSVCESFQRLLYRTCTHHRTGTGGTAGDSSSHVRRQQSERNTRKPLLRFIRFSQVYGRDRLIGDRHESNRGRLLWRQ
ncbi:hypothetical protein DVR14_11635 [Natrinema thermotolerans]|nr:hypothetical protein DVR14_11635 [Natrinema thermotolerans]